MFEIHRICRGLVIVMTLSAAACQEPEDAALSYQGNEFVIGFTKTTRESYQSLNLYVTTSETQTVNFNVTDSRLGNTRTYSVNPNELTHVVLTYDYNAVEYDADDKFSNKGIYIKAEGNKTISFYAFNSWMSGAEGYLALPCNRLPINEYRYSALTYFNATGDSLNIPDFILVVGCEDSTNISVSTELGPVELNKQQTYLIDSTSDLSGVVVVSDKPIFFLAGHIGFRGSSAESRYRNYFGEQIPPTATWGSFFLVADLPGFEYLNRSTGAKLRILSELKSTTVFLNCNVKPISGDQYSFDRAAEYHGITLKPNSYCTIESNRPVLVMQYSPEYSKQFYMTVLPPTDQYCNYYILHLEPQTTWITLYVTPLHYQKNSIFVDGKTLQKNWTNIYCHNNTLCGHYISLSVYNPYYVLRVYHAAKNAKIGVIVNGESYAYPGGLCVVSVHNLGFSWMPDRHAVSSGTVDIHPSKSSFPTSSVMLTTGISGRPSTDCQQSSAHFLLTSATHVLPSPIMLQLSTVYSNLTMARSEIPTNVTHKPGTTGTTAIHINSDTFLRVRTPTLATKSSTSISVVQTATVLKSIPVSSTPRASSSKQFPVAIISVSVGVTVIIITTVTAIVLARVLRRNYRNCVVHHHYSLLNGSRLQQYLCSCRKPEQGDYDREDNFETPLLELRGSPIPTTPDDAPAAENDTSITEGGTLVSLTKVSTEDVPDTINRLDQRPKLPELKTLKLHDGQKVEVILSLAPKWKDFGISLDFDDNGTMLDLIEAQYTQKGPTECCTQMLKHWLSNNGKQPVSWRTFIELLEDCKQGYLAQQLKEALQS